MKKIIALVLALALTMGCCAALAESAEKTELGTLNGAFKILCVVPDGYKLSIPQIDNEGLIAQLSAVDGDEKKPDMWLVVEFDELYYDIKRMNDMTDEQLDEIIQTFPDNGENVTVSYSETAYGTKVMIVKDSNVPPQNMAVLSVYEGFMIEIDAIDIEEGLTDEEIQLCIDFFSNMDFIPTED